MLNGNLSPARELGQSLLARDPPRQRGKMRNISKLTGAALAAALLAAPLAAQAQVSIGVSIAPPAPRYERPPPPRPGYVWAPGHWNYTGGHYVWGGGTWIRARPGYRWVNGSWAQRGSRWHYVPGHWVR